MGLKIYRRVSSMGLRLIHSQQVRRISQTAALNKLRSVNFSIVITTLRSFLLLVPSLLAYLFKSGNLTLCPLIRMATLSRIIHTTISYVPIRNTLINTLDNSYFALFFFSRLSSPVIIPFVSSPLTCLPRTFLFFGLYVLVITIHCNPRQCYRPHHIQRNPPFLTFTGKHE